MNITNKIILSLCKLGERQGKKERAAAKVIKDFLNSLKIPFKRENFQTTIPLWTAELKADKKRIPCKGASLKSGVIKNKNNIISSLLDCSQSNINFNPCSEEISLANIYLEPSLAVSKKDIPFILKSKKLKGLVKVKKFKFTSENILLGNIKNPQNLIFTHYDSIETGAVDNASGVAVVITSIFENPKLLKDNLFVIAGNEELSFDFPEYWGRGYRDFEKKHLSLFRKAKKIIIADSLGQTKPKVSQEQEIVYLALPIKNLKILSRKIYLISGSLEELMKIYHTKLDNPGKINQKFLRESVNILVKSL